MIENIPSKLLRCHVYRLAFAGKLGDFLQAQGLGPKSDQQVKEFLHSYGARDTLSEVCDAPFGPTLKPRRTPRESRFSNGSFPVFYSSLESRTTDAEVKYRIPSFVGNPACPRTMYYRRIRCKFDGRVKDLRDKQRDWPELTHKSDYRFCNKLGAEAIKFRINAFLTPSARRKNGTNAPIFTRESISDPQLVEYVSVTYDPDKNCTTICSL